ncbi:MAG: hypothetical protein QM784_24350 [Polyangiaceae bacterium]
MSIWIVVARRSSLQLGHRSPVPVARVSAHFVNAVVMIAATERLAQRGRSGDTWYRGDGSSLQTSFGSGGVRDCAYSEDGAFMAALGEERSVWVARFAEHVVPRATRETFGPDRNAFFTVAVGERCCREEPVVHTGGYH